MVSFICNACGQTVKKAQVERHYQNECPSCDVLSCIDCGKDFHGNDYVLHTKCITEAEKYQGKLYRPKDKQNKGEQKQQEWLKNVKEVTKSERGDPRITSLLERISEYSNIPRKRAKFQNFCKNSINVRDSKTLDQLWDIFSESTKELQTSNLSNNEIAQHENDKTSTDENAVKTSEEFKGSAHKHRKQKKSKDNDICDTKCKSKVKQNGDAIEEVDAHKIEKKRKRKRRDDNIEDEGELKLKVSKGLLGEDNNTQDQEAEKLKSNFKWKSVIKGVLREAPDQELPIKRLRKKDVVPFLCSDSLFLTYSVLAEFNARGANDRNLSDNELRSLFKNKVSKNPIFKVHKDRVKLVK